MLILGVLKPSFVSGRWGTCFWELVLGVRELGSWEAGELIRELKSLLPGAGSL
jgi:hypothetical protein